MINILIFIISLIFVFLIESLFLKIKIDGKIHKQYHFKFSRYIFYILFLFISSIFIFYKEGSSIFLAILAFSILGPIFEWFIGISYHKIVGQRLWTYHRGTVYGYTSFLAIPLWAFGGILAWLIVNLIK